MHSQMSRASYASKSIFDFELENIFKRLWLLAAIRPMVAQHMDFRTIEIAGIPIIIQNLGGRVRAFANICRHRLGRIHAEEFGSRALICPYHHWSYDNDGALKSVPRNSSLFKFSAAQMHELRLQEFHVETIGALIFVNLSANPISIEQQFDKALIGLLTSATEYMDDDYIYTRYPVGFNWKTGMENIKDPLHVQCLHRESFPSEIKIDLDQQSIPSTWDHNAAPVRRKIELSQGSVYIDVSIEQQSSQPWKELVTSLNSKGLYRGIHLFPNVNIMIVDGTSYSIQIYNPLRPDQTDMQMMVALTRPIRPFNYKPVVLWEHLRSDMKVLQEDIDCLENLQRGLGAAQFEMTHGVYESGIMDFHAVYFNAMEGFPNG